MRTTPRRLLTLAVALATTTGFMLAVGAGAQAATPGSTTCSGGSVQAPATLPPGSYKNVEIAGFCGLDPSVAISGNVTVDPGAGLQLSGASIGGNLSVGSGAILFAYGTHVGGNVSASNAHALYMFFSQVGKNLTVQGGGSGRNCTDPDPDTSFGNDTMVKDSHIAGNMTFSNWAGCWFGVLRNTVGGNMTIANMYANPLNANFPGTPDQVFQGLDSTEVGANTVGGVLSCSGNTPAAQLGDSGAAPNAARKAVGECAVLV
ncbi:hypothetical protein [Leifsonia shinshuensis]|uniref:Uncharacterized protein n=1 Tax=Leifsonia shinshuensis TaxID=150026 RepID=A0A7G6YD24_9MICO|nr:hypothetical protein [Leifsonia shinshuensis]QNE36389.1 hypothetical protein F1C12_15560 [Leifsonia shinshuensis]